MADDTALTTPSALGGEASPYFAMLVSDDNDISYFHTVELALRELNYRQNGTVVLFYLRPGGRITDDWSRWWMWDNRSQRVKRCVIRTTDDDDGTTTSTERTEQPDH